MSIGDLIHEHTAGMVAADAARLEAECEMALRLTPLGYWSTLTIVEEALPFGPVVAVDWAWNTVVVRVPPRSVACMLPGTHPAMAEWFQSEMRARLGLNADYGEVRGLRAIFGE